MFGLRNGRWEPVKNRGISTGKEGVQLSCLIARVQRAGNGASESSDSSCGERRFCHSTCHIAAAPPGFMNLHSLLLREAVLGRGNELASALPRFPHGVLSQWTES